MRHCIEEGLPLDFLSTHSYPTDPVLLQEPTGFSAAIEGMTRMVHSYLPGIPIYLSEYNSGLFADLNHDSSFASSYIILSTSDLIQRKVELDIWSYWTFSDIFEEQAAQLARPGLQRRCSRKSFCVKIDQMFDNILLYSC